MGFDLASASVLGRVARCRDAHPAKKLRHFDLCRYEIRRLTGEIITQGKIREAPENIKRHVNISYVQRLKSSLAISARGS